MVADYQGNVGCEKNTAHVVFCWLFYGHYSNHLFCNFSLLLVMIGFEPDLRLLNQRDLINKPELGLTVIRFFPVLTQLVTYI